MQEENENKDRELLFYLAEREALAEKKAKIYSRLLTEPNLAENMETLAVRHEKRKKSLVALAEGKEEQA